MDFESVAAAGSMLGSGGVTIMEEGTSMVWAALRLMEFFYHESCGKCTPCREGTSWLVQTMRRIVNHRGQMEDLETLTDLCKNIAGRTVCAFGDAAIAPIQSTLKHWRQEYVSLIHQAEAANLIRPEPVAAKH
jgi:NADH-quinone oxidoreductase subunit F